MVGATVFFETALPPSTSILLTRQGRVGGGGGLYLLKIKEMAPVQKY